MYTVSNLYTCCSTPHYILASCCGARKQASSCAVRAQYRACLRLHPAALREPPPLRQPLSATRSYLSKTALPPSECEADGEVSPWHCCDQPTNPALCTRSKSSHPGSPTSSSTEPTSSRTEPVHHPAQVPAPAHPRTLAHPLPPTPLQPVAVMSPPPPNAPVLANN